MNLLVRNLTIRAEKKERNSELGMERTKIKVCDSDREEIPTRRSNMITSPEIITVILGIVWRKEIVHDSFKSCNVVCVCVCVCVMQNLG